MLINFGNGKCPLCGDFGKEIVKEVFHCPKCNVTFNNFSLSSYSEIKTDKNKFWN
ncbi:MAG: hypothetical protein QXD48_03310 [Candidatus Aenigmatarchaeota archaeon]